MARKKYGFWIDVAQAEGLKLVKTRDGVPESEQVRRAIADSLMKRAVAGRDHPSPRRRIQR